MTLFTRTMLCLSLVVVAGCAQYDNKRGVLQEVRPSDLAQFTSGETSR